MFRCQCFCCRDARFGIDSPAEPIIIVEGWMYGWMGSSSDHFAHYLQPSILYPTLEKMPGNNN